MDLRAADDQRHVAAVAIAVERGLGGRVLGADDRHLLLHVAVGFAVVVVTFGRSSPARPAGWAGRRSRSRRRRAGRTLGLLGHHHELALLAAHGQHALVEAQRDLLARRNAAVVLEALLARWLVALDGERVAADLDQVGVEKNSMPAG